MKNMVLLFFGLGVMVYALPARAMPQDPKEHFVPGQMRGSLSWDNISAMESGEYKFGGAAGIYVLNGLEIGIHQQFVVPSDAGSKSLSWAYLRYVPFRNWVVAPFLSTRAGYLFLPDRDATAASIGVGMVFFLDDHIAFEASVFTSGVVHSSGEIERMSEFDWNVVLYF